MPKSRWDQAFPIPRSQRRRFTNDRLDRAFIDDAEMNRALKRLALGRYARNALVAVALVFIAFGSANALFGDRSEPTQPHMFPSLDELTDAALNEQDGSALLESLAGVVTRYPAPRDDELARVCLYVVARSKRSQERRSWLLTLYDHPNEAVRREVAIWMPRERLRLEDWNK